MPDHNGAMTNGELGELVCEQRKHIEELKARIAKALNHLPEHPGMAMGFLMENDDD